MSLLDKASLVQIPSGYKEDKLYSVVPDSGAGDFDFSRSSSATRVNSEGLIETAKVLGTTEEVTNGNFATNSDWNGSASISNGQLTKTGNGLAYQGISGVSNGGLYKIVVDVQLSVASLKLYVGGTQVDLSQGVNTLNVTSRGLNNFVGFNNGYDSGTSIGAVINSISVIEYIENDVPRLDYSDASCACLLLEPQSTNLVTQSETFSNWGTEGGKQVVTQGVLISPDGTLNGNKLETYNSTNSNQRKLWIAKTVTVGASYTFSVYIKQVSGQINSGFLHITTGANDTFDVSQAYTATDQWQRVSVTTNSAVSSQIRFLITGDANSQIYIWGGQVEQQSYPTSYIPTSGSTTTRTADVCNNAGTSATFNDSEGVLFAEMAALSDDQTSRAIAIDGDGTNENRVIIQYQPSFSNQIRALLKNNDNSSVELTYVLSDITDYAKIAFKYKSGDLALWVNGVERDTSSDIIFLSNLQELSFDNGRGSNNFFGKCKQLIYFNEALTDTELAALTTI